MPLPLVAAPFLPLISAGVGAGVGRLTDNLWGVGDYYAGDPRINLTNPNLMSRGQFNTFVTERGATPEDLNTLWGDFADRITEQNRLGNPVSLEQQRQFALDAANSLFNQQRDAIATKKNEGWVNPNAPKSSVGSINNIINGALQEANKHLVQADSTVSNVNTPTKPVEQVDPLGAIDRTYRWKYTPESSGYITDGDKTISFTENPNGKTVTKTAAEGPLSVHTVEYPKKGSPTPTPAALLDTTSLAKAIMQGQFGNGAARRQTLTNAGYSPEQIQAAQQVVNQQMRRPVRRTTPRRDINSVVATPVQQSVQQAVQPEVNLSGYATGHEAYYDPFTSQLRFR